MGLPQLVIIEWKRNGRAENSKLKPLLRELMIKQSSFSKVVEGIAFTDYLLKVFYESTLDDSSSVDHMLKLPKKD